jgi:nitrous oxide reductase accessory protein NosL
METAFLGHKRKPRQPDMRVSLKQYWEVFVLVAVLLGTLPLAYGGKAQHRTICQLCGMDAAKSETEFILRRNTEPELHACCINCARRLMKKLGAEITEVTALDFSTRKYVPAANAFYVVGSKRIPKGSMVPFVFTFGSRENAEKFKDRYGGVVLEFSEILEKCGRDR